MALLAYDPERVRRLHRELAEAATELRSVACADPAATDAMRVVRTAIAALEMNWAALVSRLLDTDPLAAGQRREANINSLEQALIRVMADGYGWAVQRDPLTDDAAVVTAEEARALAVTLDSIDPEALANDPIHLAWLAQQLAIIGRDPALSADFLVNFRNWDTLTMVLARQRAASFGNEYRGATVAADIDPVFDGLAAVWRRSLPARVAHAGTDATVADLLPPTLHRDPYVQALLLRSLRLGPIALATVADELLRTWLDSKELGGGESLDLAVPYGANAADLLLNELAGNPAASAYFLTLVVDRPGLLFQTLDDPDIAYRIALAGTDPVSATSPAAGRAVLAILDYFRTDPYATALSTDGYPGDYGPFLGQLVAPWLLQFTGANDEWKASDSTKAQLLSVALEDERSLQALLVASDGIAQGFARSLVIAHNDAQTLDLSLQIGGLLSLLGQLVVNEHIDDQGERSRFLWDLTWTVLATAANFVPGGPAANIVAGAGVIALQALIAPSFLGPSAQAVRHDGEYNMDLALTVAASVMLAALVRGWQSDGRLAANTPPTPVVDSDADCPGSAYRDAVERWTRNLPGAMTGTLGLTALNVVGNFIGRAQADEHCAELAPLG